MSDVINRTTLEQLFSVNTPDYSTETWIINPDLSGVSGVVKKYWKIVGDSVVEMNQSEKDAVDASDLQDAKDDKNASLLAACKDYEVIWLHSKAVYLLVNSLSLNVNNSSRYSKINRWQKNLWSDYRIRKSQVDSATSVSAVEAVSEDFSNNIDPWFGEMDTREIFGQ